MNQTTYTTPSRSLAKKALACAASILLASTIATPAFAADAATYEKDENVYGTLASNGTTEKLYVVNQFDVASPGAVRDYGSYDKVSNLTDASTIASSEGLQEFSAGKGMFYYQGDIDNGELPWNFDIAYTLDGATIDARDLAGKSGHLTIHITSSEGIPADALFYESYLLQVSYSIPLEKCQNTSVGNSGTIADAGSKRQFTYTAMPGKDADLTFQSDVTDFEMSAMSIVGAPAAVPGEAASGANGKPGSFVSAENNNTQHVQFALATQAIEPPASAKTMDEQPKKSFIERVLALFGM